MADYLDRYLAIEYKPSIALFVDALAPHADALAPHADAPARFAPPPTVA